MTTQKLLAYDRICAHLEETGWREIGYVNFTPTATQKGDMAMFAKNGRTLIVQGVPQDGDKRGGVEVWYPSPSMKVDEIVTEIDAHAAGTLVIEPHGLGPEYSVMLDDWLVIYTWRRGPLKGHQAVRVTETWDEWGMVASEERDPVVAARVLAKAYELGPPTHDTNAPSGTTGWCATCAKQFDINL